MKQPNRLVRFFKTAREAFDSGREQVIWISCTVLSLVFLAFDLSVPLGVAGGVPYVMVIMLALRSKTDAITVSFIYICSFLTLIGLFMSEPAGELWMVLTNRVLALIAILATGLLGLHLKKLHLKLIESEGRFQLMADQAPIMIWQSDKKGQCNYLSKGWHDYTGMMHENETSWLQGIVKDQQQYAFNTFRDALSNKQSFKIECQISHANGKYRWNVIQGAPKFLKNGEFSGFIGVAIDIDDWIKAEQALQETREKLFHKEKMAVIGTLGSGILHEIGNPVASISGLLNEMLFEIQSLDDQAQKHQTVNEKKLITVLQYIDQLVSVNRDILDFTTMQGDTVEPNDLNDFINRTCKLVAHDERMLNIKIELDLDYSLPALNISTDHFIQMLLILLENAIADSYREGSGGLIRVQSRQDETHIYLEIWNEDNQPENRRVKSLDNVESRCSQFETESEIVGLELCRSIIAEYGGTVNETTHSGKAVIMSFPKVI